MDSSLTPPTDTSGWAPPWSSRADGVGGIWVVNTAAGTPVYVDFPREALPGMARQLSGWLEGYRFISNRDRLATPVGFLYLVLGDKFFGNAAYSSRPAEAVIEIGYGSEPVAPQDAEDVPLGGLIDTLIRELDAGAQPVEVPSRP